MKRDTSPTIDSVYTDEQRIESLFATLRQLEPSEYERSLADLCTPEVWNELRALDQRLRTQHESWQLEFAFRQAFEFAGLKAEGRDACRAAVSDQGGVVWLSYEDDVRLGHVAEIFLRALSLAHMKPLDGMPRYEALAAIWKKACVRLWRESQRMTKS